MNSLRRQRTIPSLYNAFVASALLVLLIILYRYHGQSSIIIQHRNSSPDRTNILNSTLGFQKVFAINLPERTDHRDALILQSSVSGFQIDIIDGVRSEIVPEKVLPFGHNSDLPPGVIGSWRAHLNVIGKIVQHGFTTTLILEDDVDWDIRLKSLLHDVAISTNAMLQNPGVSLLDFNKLPPTSLPKSSPYGDEWDVMWLGHCGMSVAEDLALVHYNDVSVPQPHYLRSYDIHAKTPLHEYPNHTRIVTRPRDGTCSLAYAVSLNGARKILYDIGLQRFDMAFDLMLRDFCMKSSNVCFGVLPQLFDHHRRKGPPTGDSDVSQSIDPDRERAFTNNIRQSVRLNMDRILAGRNDWDDQYPDT